MPVADLAAVDAFAQAHSPTLDTYVGVASRATADGRNLSGCLELHAVFADLDFKDSSEPECRDRLSAFPLTPTAVVHSGGGLQAYWWLTEPLRISEEIKANFARLLLASLARILKADTNAAEPARILRLPGTLNHKYAPPRPVIIETLNMDVRHDYRAFSIVPLGDVPSEPHGVIGTSKPYARTAQMADHIPDGGRNTALFRTGCKLRRQGYQESEILGLLLAANQERCSPPLDRREVENIARGCARYEPAKDTFPATETGDAEFFVAAFGDSVRFDHRRARWVVFEHHIWSPQTNGEIARLALDAIRARQRAAVGNEKRIAWAVGGEKRGRQIALLSIAENLLPVADRGEDWDRNPWLVGTPNGVIDLRTGYLRPGEPDDRITLRVGAPYDPNATCPLFINTIAEIFGGDKDLIDYVHRALGYSLSGDCREEVFFLLWGDGANGKSTLIGIVTFVLGDYADDLPFSALERSRFGGGIPNDIAKLVGRRTVTASESNDVRLNEARIKALTGRDPITARFLHQEFFTFEPVAKFWLTTNTKPEVRDDSEGFWRRVHLIPFTQSFIGKEDKKLKDKLRAEASGILTWLVRGCIEWQRNGLKPPAAVLNATAEYRRESQQLAQFISALCIVQEHARVQAGELYKHYVSWCRGEQLSPDLNQRTFGEAMRRKFSVREGKTVEYLGVGLLTLLRDPGM